MFRVSSLIAIMAVILLTGSLNINAQSSTVFEGIEAYLFNSRTGKFSADVLGDNTPLGNVIIGEYSSVSTFIKVKLKLPKGTSSADAKIKILAKENNATPFTGSAANAGSKVILNSTVNVGPLNDDGTAFVGFWLNNTGCKAIEITVSAAFADSKQEQSASLPFACYE